MVDRSLYANKLLATINKAWKKDIRSAALSHENRKRPSSSILPNRKKKNLAAAYHGLLHVCGRAGCPDIALRLVYAMSKEGVEPNETSLNSYNAGKKIREISTGQGDEKQGAIRRAITNQYETLLTVECTKYEASDKRRKGDRRVRIIF